MASAGDIHDSSRPPLRGFCGILQLIHEQIGEEKMPNMIGTKLDLNSFLRSLLVQYHHAGVVDQYVHSIDFGLDLRCGGMD